MLPRRNNNEMEIEIMLDEPITSDSCTKLVMEIIKYILYQKQQIPFTYETLVQFQTTIKATDRNAVFFRTLSNTLKSVSDHLSSQFFLKGCDVKEVAILLGATIISPKLCIEIELPSYVLNSKQHKEYQHSPRKPLLKLMRSMLECEEFQKAMDIPLNVTNMFIMLRKRDINPISEFFLLKPQYISPTHNHIQNTSCFKIKLCQKDLLDMQCNCRTLVQVYDDSCETNLENDDDDDVQYSQYDSSTRALYRWYQSKQIIKGYKFHS